MKTVLWLSRHPPIEKQVLALEEMYGEGVDVRQDVNPFENADEVSKRYRDGGYDDIVVVAPLTVIRQLCKAGIRPLYAKMSRAKNGRCDMVHGGRGLVFERFRRITGVEITYEDAEQEVVSDAEQTSAGLPAQAASPL